MHEWSHIPTVIAGETREGDRVVLHRGRPVGRVIFEIGTFNGAKPWTWSKTTVPGKNGREDTLEEALEAVREAVRGEVT